MTFDDVPGQFFVSTDKALLDAPWIFDQLRRTYWGDYMTMKIVLTAIDHSVCFGLYERVNGLNKQIGYARIVTDYSTFAWLCDVFVAAPYRKQGLGKFLLATMLRHPAVRERNILLSTKDAQDFYAKFGFQQVVTMKRTGDPIH